MRAIRASSPGCARAGSISHRSPKRGHPGRGEVARGFQDLHGPVAAAYGDERAQIGAAGERVLERSARPFHAFLLREEWRADQKERSERNRFGSEPVRGLVEIVDGHALVEPIQHDGMDGLEANGNLEARGMDQIAQPQGAGSNESGVGFHDHAIEPADTLGDRGVVRLGNRARIEKRPGVVELDRPSRGQRRKRRVDLAGNVAGAHGIGEGVLP